MYDERVDFSLDCGVSMVGVSVVAADVEVVGCGVELKFKFEFLDCDDGGSKGTRVGVPIESWKEKGTLDIGGGGGGLLI